MMPRQSLVSGQTDANCKADVPFTELNVMGWHFPPRLVDKTAENGFEHEGEAHLCLKIRRERLGLASDVSGADNAFL